MAAKRDWSISLALIGVCAAIAVPSIRRGDLLIGILFAVVGAVTVVVALRDFLASRR